MSPEGEKLLHQVADCKSVAITGLAKNAGKTESLNFLLGGLDALGVPTGVTSVGVDGESTDRVTSTSKPEIFLYPGMLFATTEAHYGRRQIQSELLGIGRRTTPLGRIAFARALGCGKTLLSGPSDSPSLARAIERLSAFGARTVLVDGALSRQSLASPAICRGMVLSTGAAVSRTVSGVARATGHLLSLIALPTIAHEEALLIRKAPKGISAIRNGRIEDLGIPTALSLENAGSQVFSQGRRLVVNGALTDRLVRWLALQKEVEGTEITVRDFTCLFVSADVLAEFRRRGGSVKVARKPELLALTMNPFSPDGYRLDTEAMAGALRRELERNRFDIPLLDVRRETLQRYL